MYIHMCNNNDQSYSVAVACSFDCVYLVYFYNKYCIFLISDSDFNSNSDSDSLHPSDSQLYVRYDVHVYICTYIM